MDQEEIRCLKCNKLLAKGDQGLKTYEIKCVRCGTLNSLLKEIPYQVVITDPNGIILYANAETEAITGYSLSEILGRKPSLWGGQMPAKFYRQMWRTIKTHKRGLLVKVRNRRKDGATYEAKLRISPVLDTNGEIRLFVGLETVFESTINQSKITPNSQHASRSHPPKRGRAPVRRLRSQTPRHRRRRAL